MGRMVCSQRQQIRLRVPIHPELGIAGNEWVQETGLDSDKTVYRCLVAADDFRRRGGEGGRFHKDSGLV